LLIAPAGGAAQDIRINFLSARNPPDRRRSFHLIFRFHCRAPGGHDPAGEEQVVVLRCEKSAMRRHPQRSALGARHTVQGIVQSN
jgi:hypothetical protein